MRKFLLYSSAFVAFTMSGMAEAACIQTPSCSSLGYDSSKACEGGLKCPFGNAWNCTVVDLTNKITEFEKQITEIINNGCCSSAPDYSNCRVGDILYSDKSCDPNVVASKKPIGVVFERADRLAIALDTEEKAWSEEYLVVLEYCKTKGKSCPAFEYVNSYKTEGTQAGDWYLPAAGELNIIYGHMDVLNTALGKIGGTKLSTDFYWSSSELSNTHAWRQMFEYNGPIDHASKANYPAYVRPVLAF